MPQSIHQAAFGHDVREADAFLGQRDDTLPHIPGLLAFGAGAEEHCCAVDGTDPDDLRKHPHRVGCAVH